MTYLEKCLLEYPNFSKDAEIKVALAKAEDVIVNRYCPGDFGYSNDLAIRYCNFKDNLTCVQCWNREIPETNNVSKQSTLKPCPFCGGEAELVKDTRCEGHGDYVEYTYVQCTECEARGPYGSDYEDRSNMTTIAIQGWNDRKGE